MNLLEYINRNYYLNIILINYKCKQMTLITTFGSPDISMEHM